MRSEKQKELFSARIIKKFQQEQEISIIAYLTRLLRQIINEQNYRQILQGLFDKFRLQNNQLALEVMLDMETDMICKLKQEQLVEFHKFYLLYILIPLIDLLSSNMTNLTQRKHALDNLTSKLLQISVQRDQEKQMPTECAKIVLDWCIQNLTFQLGGNDKEKEKGRKKYI